MRDLVELAHREHPDAIVMITPAGVIADWNQGAQTAFGYTPGEAIGQSYIDLIVPPDQQAAEQAEMGLTMQRGASVREALRRRKDGSLVYVDISSKAIESTGGEIEFILSCEKDITELKVLRLSKMMEGRFGDLLESTPDGIILAGPTGRVVIANSQAEHLFGYKHGELHGKLIELLLPDRYHAAHIRHRSGYFKQPRTRSMGAGLELFGRRKDGSEFPVEISLSPLKTEEGTLVMSAIRDISERLKAERKFRGLLESAPDAMVIVNQLGQIVLVNSQTEKLFGYQRDAMLGKAVEMLIPARFHDAHPGHRNTFFREPRPRAMGAGSQLFGQRQDGTEFPVEISLSPLETEEGLLVSGAIRDISERRHFERVLQEKNIELEAAAEAKDRFLANMSHELRTPLNAIIGFTGTLLMRLAGPLLPDQEKQLQTVLGSAKHLLSLINDLLDLAKIESGKVELNFVPVSFAEVIAEVAAVLRPLAEKKAVEFVVNVPDEALVAHADRRALSQIVINLANNAIKFTDGGGRVTLLLRRSLRDGQALIEISVADTGCGIRDEDHASLFQAFAQLDSSSTRHHEGTGLGLHLSQKLATLLGGRITLQSEIGKGSTFTLVIPEFA